jgi:hypothetical protein
MIIYYPSFKKYENHRLHQYKFLLDTDGNLLKNLQLLHTETLQEDMQSLGYDDFCQLDNKGTLDSKENFNYSKK